ncbi:toll-like receptor Tollo [Schistocerca gregaria]|uniref:toll-like receptor Tollo n=1 Tax=Schistocerca gregaria TaxID=7010 RepID=UPI00211E9FB9|nr:toll-like receptor Tollo [Schistocerca gregaria]
MQPSPLVFTVLLGTIFGVLSASLSKALRYQAPDECKWVVLDDGEDVALDCRLRTINSELENTNFSVIQPQHTVRLRLECSDVLFFQSSLSTGSFRPLQELRELVIEFCKIGNLSAGAFRGLRQLRNLTLRTHNTDWAAMTLDVDRDAFSSELGLLERLDLAENNMWSLPVGVFCSLHSLEVLNLTRNRLRDVARFQFGLGAASGSGPAERCGGNLRELDLSNNSVDALPASALSGLSRLQTLNLQGNAISFLADRALEGLSSLSVLHLADNRLVSLPPELFADTRDIKEVYLRNNSVNVLAPGLFNDLSQLLVLDLSHNELTAEWVNSATFSGLVRLVILNLSHNRIAKLETAVFRDLYSLQILRLEENVIENIPENTFASLYNLHTLFLSGNRLVSIESYTFNGLYVLSLLSLDNNLISNIHPAALKNSSSLQDLHLNGNSLVAVPSVLLDVPMLRTLDLGENHISEIANSSFSDMQHLYGLRLTDNNIGNITKGTFDRMSALKILNLSRNKIYGIESGAFDNNKNLQAVRLDGNYLTNIDGLFNKLERLIWLNISDNKLEWFDYALIPTGLQWLDIHANQITELGNYLEIESQLHLSTFDASSNKLTEVTGSSIPDSVELLYLNDNLITKVQSYTFFKKPNLTRVDLFGNKITNLNPNSLRISTVPNSRPLPEFYISGNPYLCDCTMDWLQRINVDNRGTRNQPRVMDLHSIHCKLLYSRGRTYMPLTEASPKQFLCKYEFHCFALCHCCDFDACDCKMTCPTNCTCYHDQSWTANAVNCASSGYDGQLPEQIPMDATQLYLDGNDFRSLGSHAFIGRKRLKILFLNASGVEIIHNRTFNGLKELELLHLEDNRLRELRGYEFDGLESLKELYLHRNFITSIHNSTFSPLRHLKVLKLDNNRISHYAVWTLPASLTELTLSNNSWQCDCDYAESFKDYLLKTETIVSDASRVQCFRRSGAANDTQDFSDDADYIGFAPDSDGYYILSNSSLPCFGAVDANETTAANITATKTVIQKQAIQDYIPQLVAALCVLLVLVLTVLLIFIFRQEMRVWFHSRFGIRLFYRHSDIDHEDRDKLFDAFVSYSSKDEAFVAEELAPILEHGDPPYKLCLHYRDFPVGAYIGETIVQAVESSRRTIMVLSDNFIRSEWCRFEFKSAHHQVLRDRRRRLILVLLGEVPQKDLDPDIRLYLKTNTYLQWGDKLFWEKLRFALPDVPNNQRRRTTSVPLQPQPSTRGTNNHVHAMHRHNNQAPPNNANARSVAIHI